MKTVRTNSDKRTHICSIYYVLASVVSVENYETDLIRIIGNWSKINHSDAAVEETQILSGEFVKQTIKIAITGSSKALVNEVQKIASSHILLRVDYSGGEKRIFGTDENPVVLKHEKSGSPNIQTLSCDRLSTDFSKILME